MSRAHITADPPACRIACPPARTHACTPARTLHARMHAWTHGCMRRRKDARTQGCKDAQAHARMHSTHARPQAARTRMHTH
eukprot:15285195-Alexandrium_andersonii.AAC.1